MIDFDIRSNRILKDIDRKSFAYIVDGKTLGLIFKHNFQEQFRHICMQCDAVLCCRMSPSQKAQVNFALLDFFYISLNLLQIFEIKGG